MAEDLLVVRDLNFSYTSGVEQVQALEEVSFSVQRDEIVAITGPNGGGKTTLLRILAGLLKAERGMVSFGGNSPRAFRKKIGYVPQHAAFDRKFPMTVFDVVLSGLVKPLGFHSGDAGEKAMKALKDTGIHPLKNRHIESLSGGQSQRMLIARALVSETEVLLMDEPTTGIDSESARQLKELIRKLNKNKTIFLVTHDAEFVKDLADRIFNLDRRLTEKFIRDKKTSKSKQKVG
jgi:zinc transport system ATP-binding protein